MRQGLIIYGDPATGKSTLDMNLRACYFSSALTKHHFQFDGKRCFLGKTAKHNGRLMATGGAEALTTLEGIPECELYIAAIPSHGREGTKLAWEFLKSLDKLTAICLWTMNSGKYRQNRVRYFSGRDTKMRFTRSPLRIPPQVRDHDCHAFTTENLYEAFEFALEILGAPRYSTSANGRYSLRMLEEFDHDVSYEPSLQSSWRP